MAKKVKCDDCGAESDWVEQALIPGFDIIGTTIVRITDSDKRPLSSWTELLCAACQTKRGYRPRSENNG